MLRATNETYAACNIPIRDHTATLIGPVASIGALALVMVLMRLVDRLVSAHAQLGWDDLLIGLSGVGDISMLSGFTELTVWIAGLHRYERTCCCCCAPWVRKRYVGHPSR